MKRYFYFRDVANEDADDDISASIAFPVDSLTGVTPRSITQLDLFFAKQGMVIEQKISLTVTRGYLQEVMQTIAAYANRHPHHSGLSVMGDMATTTHGTLSVEGNDKTKSTIFFSPHVTSAELGDAAY